MTERDTHTHTETQSTCLEVSEFWIKNVMKSYNHHDAATNYAKLFQRRQLLSGGSKFFLFKCSLLPLN